MNRVVYTLAIIIFLFAVAESCKKQNVAATNPLTGTWNWVSTYQDFQPTIVTPLSSGISQSLTFTANSWSLIQYNSRVSSSLLTTGTYSIDVIDTLGYNNVNCIHYHRGNAMDSLSYYVIKNDTLTFSYSFIGNIGASVSNYLKQ